MSLSNQVADTIPSSCTKMQVTQNLDITLQGIPLKYMKLAGTLDSLNKIFEIYDIFKGTPLK